MRVLIEARSLINRAGTGVYCKNLIENLMKIDKKNEYLIIVPSEQRYNFNASNFKMVPLKSKGFLNRIIGDLKIKSIVKNKKIDVVHYTKGIGPRIKGAKLISTINDVIPLTHPHFNPNLITFYWKLNLPKNIRNSDKLITISNYSKEDLIRLFPDCSLKVRVIYDGCSVKKITKINHKGNYLLFLSRVQKRKNIEGTILAFERLAKKNNKLKLIIAGIIPREGKFIYKIIKNSKYADRIELKGHIDENKKIKLILNANALVFASFAEGFGLPILEAQACGCPVITSNISSMPEVAGKGAILVDPYNVEEIAKAMEKVPKDKKLRGDLIKEGYKNIKRFSWEKCARETLRVYGEAYNE